MPIASGHCAVREASKRHEFVCARCLRAACGSDEVGTGSAALPPSAFAWCKQGQGAQGPSRCAKMHA